MEKERRQQTYSFTRQVDGVQKLFSAGTITEEDARNTIAILAIETLMRVERGLQIKDADMAVGFLTKNWAQIPTDIKSRLTRSNTPRVKK